jgi:hypothetical protein
MMPHTIILKPEHYKLLTGASSAFCLIQEFFSMVLEFPENPKLGDLFLLFLALWNNTHIRTVYHVITNKIQDFNNLFKFIP